jgi:lichenan operon transcriptional antiterminator
MEPGTMYSNKRYLSILFTLIKSKTYVTSVELSTLLNVSVRTIKRDILNLKEVVNSYGFEIDARRGSGYCINIIDNSLFESFQGQLFSKYTHINEILVSETESRSEQLLIILLSANRYLSVNELSNTLYLNSRTITVLLKQIKPVLDHYSLSLRSKPNHGLKIEGAEIHRRICMTDTYMNFIKSKLSKSIEGSLETLLGCSLTSFLRVKNVIIQASLKYGKKIENHKLQKFPYLLALTYNRARQGKRASIESMSFTYFSHFPEYRIIDEIVSQTNKIFNFVLSPNEMLVLALVYFTYVDFYFDYLSDDYAYFYDKALTYEKGIRRFLTQKTGLVFDHLTQFRKNLVIFLFSFHIKQQLKLVDTNPWHNYSRNYLHTFDQVSIDLAILAANYLKRLTNYMLCNDDIIQLAVIFNNAFTERTSKNYQLDLKR